jgi:hypothetical protein
VGFEGDVITLRRGDIGEALCQLRDKPVVCFGLNSLYNIVMKLRLDCSVCLLGVR